MLSTKPAYAPDWPICVLGKPRTSTSKPLPPTPTHFVTVDEFDNRTTSATCRGVVAAAADTVPTATAAPHSAAATANVHKRRII